MIFFLLFLSVFSFDIKIAVNNFPSSIITRDDDFLLKWKIEKNLSVFLIQAKATSNIVIAVNDQPNLKNSEIIGEHKNMYIYSGLKLKNFSFWKRT